MTSDAGNGDQRDKLRELPSVDRVIAAVEDVAKPPVLAAAARAAIDELRREMLEGNDAPTFEAVVERTLAVLREWTEPGLRLVVNATGVLVHTNLGRAPLGPSQLDAVSKVSSGYSNLEYDLDGGKRGSRYVHAQRALAALTGAESSVVVNNNAAAVLLTLAALCSGGEVIISRGELIEIGGEFRIPDVMGISGARLVEVGTTNRTHLADYERAITPDTAAILKVHPSNYRVVGFTSTVEGRDLVKLARGRGICLIHDLGSGLIEEPPGAQWVAGEPIVASAIAEGADVVTFSGDKLLGGPQAGIVAGRREILDKIRRHPLIRALRVDKMTLAALEATVAEYLTGNQQVPLWSLALTAGDELQQRAERIVASLRPRLGDGAKIEATSVMSVPGGGSLPGATVPSWGLSVLTDIGADELHARLRRSSPPVIARIADDRVILDLRAVFPEQDELIQAALGAALET